MELENLSPAKGSQKLRRRLGRGEASGQGKTSGRGHKGQYARTGGTVRHGFEGGQMPLYRRLPKVGFISPQRMVGANEYRVINLDTLDSFEDGALVDPQALQLIGYGTKGKYGAGIKLLGRGEVKKKLTVKIHAVSDAAKAKIEKAGGTVELIPKS